MHFLSIGFLTFAVISAITPGPNNVMVLASGANFGFQKSLPHIWGVSLGFAFMVAVFGLGGGVIFTRWPIFYTLLRYGGALYLLWLAWKIANAHPHFENAPTSSTPISFIQAVLYQWVNPKAIIMAVAATTLYVPLAHYYLILPIMITAYTIITFFCLCSWAYGGTIIQKLLQNSFHYRVFNIAMGILLVLSLYPLLTE
ncbi:LysE family translocator [Entomobacter blattae]|nr:LysE family translocator [Entomobacter blattae]